MLKKFAKEQPDALFAKAAVSLSDRFNGKFAADANVTFELQGYQKAKYVFVEGLEYPNFSYFLVPENGKWIGHFLLHPDEYTYFFLVDGKPGLDPKNSTIVNVDGIDHNKIVVKK